MGEHFTRRVALLAGVVCLFTLVAMSARSAASAAQDSATPPQTPGSSQSSPLPPASTTPLRSATNLVHLVVTVTDKQRSFVTDLDKSDFKILENNVPQQISFFGRETNLPLRIALLLDTSNSIRPRLEFEKDAATDFLNKSIRRDKDLAFLMTFDNEPEVIQDYTDDTYLLTEAIHRQRAGGATAFNDAIVMASQKLEHAPLPKGADTDFRRVIVVISDGNDTLSDHALTDALTAAIRAEAVVYTVSTSTDWLALDDARPRKYEIEGGDRVLQQVADQTGGHAFFPYRVDDLAESFAEIGTELRSQYFIAYVPSVPPGRGEYRKVDVQTDRKGLIVHSRKGYYAVLTDANGAAVN